MDGCHRSRGLDFVDAVVVSRGAPNEWSSSIQPLLINVNGLAPWGRQVGMPAAGNSSTTGFGVGRANPHDAHRWATSWRLVRRDGGCTEDGAWQGNRPGAKGDHGTRRASIGADAMRPIDRSDTVLTGLAEQAIGCGIGGRPPPPRGSSTCVMLAKFQPTESKKISLGFDRASC
ncbi:MAG: hypothetical protein KatS3mg111_4193 [Pirellulaceae bacterium]|nr:MAG: hypothetical protein KatS3mg111_4193 [Pirellulaceae bacterium]